MLADPAGVNPAAPFIHQNGIMIVSSNLIPRKAAIDAFHIAIATIHDMDIMLTWNCCHLANAELLRPLRLAMQARELDLPVICTQEELMGILKN